MSEQSITRRGLVMGGSAALAGVAAAAVSESNPVTAEPSPTVAQRTPTSGELNKKVAFITGAARGIGRAISP